MTTIKSTAIAAIIFAGLFGTAQAAQQTIKPVQGVSFHAGTKHAVAYYLDENRRCKLVVTTADEPKDDAPDFAATRFETAIAPGQATRYQLAEGKVIEFACQADAKAMNIRPLEAITKN